MSNKHVFSQPRVGGIAPISAQIINRHLVSCDRPGPGRGQAGGEARGKERGETREGTVRASFANAPAPCHHWIELVESKINIDWVKGNNVTHSCSLPNQTWFRAPPFLAPPPPPPPPPSQFPVSIPHLYLMLRSAQIGFLSPRYRPLIKIWTATQWESLPLHQGNHLGGQTAG